MTHRLIDLIGKTPIYVEKPHSELPENIKLRIKRTIADRDIEKVMVQGLDPRFLSRSLRISYALPYGTVIHFYGIDNEEDLGKVIERNKRHIHEQMLKFKSLEGHQIDSNDAIVALTLGLRENLQQMARSPVSTLYIQVFRDCDSSFASKTWDAIKNPWGEVRLKANRIHTLVRCNDQQWSDGSLLIHRKINLPSSVVMALPGRPLDDVIEGTWLSGNGLIIKKAWNVSRSLGMTFEKQIINIHEALKMDIPSRLRAA